MGPGGCCIITSTRVEVERIVSRTATLRRLGIATVRCVGHGFARDNAGPRQEPQHRGLVYGSESSFARDPGGPTTRAPAPCDAHGQRDDRLMALELEPSGLFAPHDPAFLADPYPALNALREATPGFWNEQTGQWTITRFSDVHEALRDRRLGRSYTPRYTHAQFGRPEPDTRWAAFHQHEAWSLLCLEPPDHTRIRRLVAKVFTPRAVAAMRPEIERWSRRTPRRMSRQGAIRIARRLCPALLGGGHLRDARRPAGTPRRCSTGRTRS